jgi:hypothetical protein
MKPYKNRGGDSGVCAYDYAADWIEVQFENGNVYRYSAAGVGASNLEAMKRLADSGDGLGSFINGNPSVRKNFDCKTR